MLEIDLTSSDDNLPRHRSRPNPPPSSSSSSSSAPTSTRHPSFPSSNNNNNNNGSNATDMHRFQTLLNASRRGRLERLLLDAMSRHPDVAARCERELAPLVNGDYTCRRCKESYYGSSETGFGCRRRVGRGERRDKSGHKMQDSHR
eukprot:TRINITY_DN4209_c0_g2_i1.p1 TRINITY_DN4209_c0_g2~~TRINITY_DN4209_c0_g2_i1.p1  ORF type:complete len:146 (+),score=20.90 TRINITY_DN4209_c0_g2_i1:293-730(+)